MEEKNKIDKKLRGGRTGTIPATHFHYDTVSSEADAVAQMVKEKASSNDYKYRDIAVLVRSNNDAEPFYAHLICTEYRISFQEAVAYTAG